LGEDFRADLGEGFWAEGGGIAAALAGLDLVDLVEPLMRDVWRSFRSRWIRALGVDCVDVARVGLMGVGWTWRWTECHGGARCHELSALVRYFLTAIPRLEAPDFHIAVKNVDWGDRLLQIYRVNWSIVLFS
jgi:hypothetical protein